MCTQCRFCFHCYPSIMYTNYDLLVMQLQKKKAYCFGWNMQRGCLTSTNIFIQTKSVDNSWLMVPLFALKFRILFTTYSRIHWDWRKSFDFEKILLISRKNNRMYRKWDLSTPLTWQIFFLMRTDLGRVVTCNLMNYVVCVNSERWQN